MKNNRWIIFLVVIFLIKAMAWLSQPMVGPYNGMGDAQVRVMLVAAQNFIPESGAWMPLPFHFIRWSLLMFDDMSMSPRILWIVINAVLAVMVGIFSARISSNRQVGLWSVFLFITHPFLSAFFTFPLTEPLFALFVISGMICLDSDRRNWRLLASIIFFSLANAIRYEGWYLFPMILGIIIARKKMSLRDMFIFSIAYWVYPIIWIRGNFIHTGEAFYFFQIKTLYARESAGYYFYNVADSLKWLWLYISHLSILGVLFLLGLIPAVYNKKFHEYPILLFITSMYLVGMLAIQRFFGTMEWFPDQYLYLPVLFAVPFAGKQLHHIFKKYLNRKWKFIGIAAICIYTSLGFMGDAHWLFKNAPDTDTELTKIIRTYKNDRILALFPKENMATDIDWLMYFSGHRSYSGAVTTDHSVCQHLYNKEFSLFLSYDTSLVFWDQLNSCKSKYDSVFQDEQYVLIRPAR
jgi:hypothetical protein